MPGWNIQQSFTPTASKCNISDCLVFYIKDANLKLETIRELLFCFCSFDSCLQTQGLCPSGMHAATLDGGSAVGTVFVSSPYCSSSLLRKSASPVCFVFRTSLMCSTHCQKMNPKLDARHTEVIFEIGTPKTTDGRVMHFFLHATKCNTMMKWYTAARQKASTQGP